MKKIILKNGEEIVIRNAVVEDSEKAVDYVCEVAGESDYLTFGENEFTMTVEQEADFIKRIGEMENALMIIALSGDELVGMLNFGGSPKKRLRHGGEFGITVRKNYWGMGIGRELLREMIDWANKNPIIRKINLCVRSDNEKAIGLYKKMGFVIEGEVSRMFYIDGKFFDCLYMGLEVD